MRIDGLSLAGEIIEHLKAQPKPQKIFAAILIGDDPRSLSFLKQKEQTAKELEIDLRLYRLPAEAGNDKLRREVGRLTQKKKVGGAIIQLPLPEGLNPFYILNSIPREKDVDVLTERALGAFYNDRNPVLPPAVLTVKMILEKVGFDLEKATVAVVGLGSLVGKPVGVWLAGRCKELRLLSKKSDFEILTTCDVVISGVGKAGIIKPEMLKEGAGVIDFGYYFNEDKIQGDLDNSSKDLSKLSFYTPTPGGTGPILVANLFRNFYTLCQPGR